MKYITITTKHHDGFAMWDSKMTDWDVVDRTPYRQGHPEGARRRVPQAGHQALLLLLAARLAPPRLLPARAHRARHGRARRDGRVVHVPRLHGRAARGAAHRIRRDRRHLVRRLVGPARGGLAPREDVRAHPRAAAAALVGATTTGSPSPARTSRCSRRTCPGRTPPASTSSPRSATCPLEMCETINGAWGYNRPTRRYKSTKDLVQLLVRAAGLRREPAAERRPAARRHDPARVASGCAEVGQWLAKNGETIYGTRGGPMPPRPWGVTTHKGDKVYVESPDWPD